MLSMRCAGVVALVRGALGVGALLVVLLGAELLLLLVLLLFSADAPAAHTLANTAVRMNAVILAMFCPPVSFGVGGYRFAR